MRTGLRKRLASVLILFVVVWPLVHFALCKTFDINPWKFYGFAMYTVPMRQIELSYVGFTNGEPERINPYRNENVKDEANRFYRNVWILGKLYPPHLLADQLLDEFPQYEEILVVEGVYRINRETKLMDLYQRQYRYSRPDESNRPSE